MKPLKKLTQISTLAMMLMATASLAHAQAEKYTGPIIDMHMHAHHVPLPLQPGSPPPCRPKPCVPDGKATATAEESMRKTLEQMDRYNIVKGFLSSAVLDLVYEWVEAAPDRFIAAPFIVEPGKLSVDMLRREYEEGRLDGMGEIGSQLVGVPPNDPQLAAYFELAAEFNVPVLIHTAGVGLALPEFRTTAGSPLLLEDVLVKHPDLKVFVENSGYPFLDEMTAMMYQYPNLYGDLSTITWVISRAAFHHYLEALVGAGLGKRLMFGSDQMRWPEKIGEAVEAIEEAEYLTEEQKRDILYHNAARFLGLSEEEIARHHEQ